MSSIIINYEVMAGIFIGDVPRIDAVLEIAVRFEQIVNGVGIVALTSKGTLRP